MVLVSVPQVSLFKSLDSISLKPKPCHSQAEESGKGELHPSTKPHGCLLFLESAGSEGWVSSAGVVATCPLKESGPEKETDGKQREEREVGGGRGPCGPGKGGLGAGRERVFPTKQRGGVRDPLRKGEKKRLDVRKQRSHWLDSLPPSPGNLLPRPLRGS